MVGSDSKKRVAILGSGPAGLMAASVVAEAGHAVTLFEKKPGPGRKLLIAGSSGLNITYDAPVEEFRGHYKGPPEHFRTLFEAFPPEAWLRFIPQLGIQTFLGTSRRYFVEGMKASTLLRAWLGALARRGAGIRYNRECAGFDAGVAGGRGVLLRFADGATESCDAACFALGGGSYEKREMPLRWPALFTDKGLRFHPFQPSNAGFEVDWPPGFLDEAEGLPLKNIRLTTALGTQNGDLVVTRYGLEGTPVYRLGVTGDAYLDLKPDLSVREIETKLGAAKENLSPIRRIKKYLGLSPAALALLFHATGRETLENPRALLERLKRLPLTLKGSRPLSEAISSSGGLAFDELDATLMLKKHPGVFAAGEMLDWDAPTGGFLIQACVSQGYLAGRGIVRFLETPANK